MPRETSRYLSSSKRRSSSSSSTSSHDRRKNKSKRRHRSRSRDSEISRRRRRSHSASYDRYRSKTKRRSESKTSSKKSKRRLSRSSSREKHRSSKSHKKSVRRRSSSTDSSSSRSSSKSERSSAPQRKFHIDSTDSKIEKAIKAAEAAGLTLTKLPTYEFKEVVVKEDMPSITDRNLLQELNNDSFVSKPFVSSRNKKFSENIVIDLDTQSIKMPEIELKEEDTILKFDELPTDEELKEMWIKKLYAHRKKLLENM